MCIIVAKKKGVKMPSDEIIKNCWDVNDDGAGIAWVEGGVVKAKKGFMKFKNYKNFIKRLARRIDLDNTDIVMHFRITSVGETLPKMTHPFRVDTTDDKRRTLLNMEGQMFVFHNGTISGVKKFEKTYSDTFAFTKGILQPMYNINKKFHTDKRFLDIIETVINGDKLAFITKEGIELVGDYVEEDGVFYSNYSFEDWSRYYSSYRSYSYYDYKPNRSYFTVPTTEEYLEAVERVSLELQSIYCDYSIEKIEAFDRDYGEDIDIIRDWESTNPDSDDNILLSCELEALGVC